MGGELPEAAGFSPIDAFEENVKIAGLAADGPHEFLIRFGRKGQRAFRTITQLIETCGKAAIHDHEQFVREIRSGFATPLCIQVLGSGIVVPVTRSLEEAQNRASRRVPTQSIGRRTYLRRRACASRDSGLSTRKNAEEKDEG